MASDSSTRRHVRRATDPSWSGLLADDGEREAVEKLNQAIAAAGDISGRFWVLGFGEGRDVPPLGATP